MRLVRTIPALPVKNIETATEFYREKFGFSVFHKEDGFAIVKRDEIEVHLWAANDEGWKRRSNLSDDIVHSGAESFIAGTASCRIEVKGIDDLFAEYRASGVLYDIVLGRHGRDPEVTTEPWGVRDFDTLDLEHNLLTFFEVLDANHEPPGD